MNKFLKFLALIVLTITLNSCVVHEDLIYRDYYTTRHYVTYDVYPHHHHHHRTVIKNKHNKPKKHYQKPQHQRPKKSQYQNRRKPSNNKNHRR